MSKAVGIDLGTTNSVVAVLEGGDPIVIANADDFSEIGFISEASAEGVVVDAAGNVYAGEVLSRNLKKFVRNER